MQLQFTTEELQFLADIVEERDEQLTRDITQAGNVEARSVLEKEREILNSLETQIVERDLHFDAEELEVLGSILAQQQRELLKERERTGTDRPGPDRLDLLKHIRDRVAETCAMF